MIKRTSKSADRDISGAFERKVFLSRIAFYFERLWPRLWLALGVAALFVILTLIGFWAVLPPLVHKIVLGLFAAAIAGALVYAVMAPWPDRDSAVRRIERRSGVRHRPATSYEDTLAPAGGSATETQVLWRAHRKRLAEAIRRLRVGRPSPRADRFDPLAIRLLLLLLIIPAALLASGNVGERFRSILHFASPSEAASTRVDAWVAPPPYTARPPIMLADGGSVVSSTPDDSDQRKFIEVPESSVLTVRGLGFAPGELSLEILSESADKSNKVVAKPQREKDGKGGPIEAQYMLVKSARIRALAGNRIVGQWTFAVTPDNVPTIEMTEAPRRTHRGSMRLSYKAEDDYGVAGAEMKVRELKAEAKKTAGDWAKLPALEGPRLPLEKPPVLSLRIPRAGSKSIESSTLLELGSHPWAGRRVEMWLEVTDVGGKVGRSEVRKMILPERRFTKPLARSLIELRRKLAEDSRHSEWVGKALDALAIAPEGFIDDIGVFVGMRTVRHRLAQDVTRETLNESIDQLWHLALRVEDGDLSEAEQALRDIQKQLSEALRNGAEDQEIQQLIAELKQRLNDYLREMQKKAQENSPADGEQQQDQQQQLGQQDLEQMMKDLERSARNGSREEAEQILSQLQEMMDRLEAGQSPEQRAAEQRAQEMMKKLNQLGDIAGQQQRLMDETYEQQRNPQRGGEQQRGGSQNDPNGQQGQNTQQGQQGQQGGQQQQGRQGGQMGRQQGGAQQGQGQRGQRGQGRGQRRFGEGSGDLQQRQGALRKELERLKKELEEMGAGDAEKLGKAEDAMGAAEQALQDKDYPEASQQQGEALENMRQGAQQLAEQMRQNAQQRMGRGGDAPRDPLGRPQRAQGPVHGRSVKVPDAFDAERAREILDELRKRSGEAIRPQMELDYIDRLLRRF